MNLQFLIVLYYPMSIIVNVKQADVHSWNEELEKLHYSLFQLREWIESVSTDKRVAIFLDFFHKDELVGKICGIITQESLLKGRLLYCFSGPAFKYPDDGELYKQCLEALVFFAYCQKCSRVYVDFWDSQWDKPVRSNIFKTIEWQEYAVGLLNGEKYEIHSKNIRKKIRSAQSAGVEIGLDNNPDLIDKLFEFMEFTRIHRARKNRKKYKLINVNYVTKSSLKKLLETKKAICHFGHLNGDIHYISFSIMNKERLYGLLNGADEKGYELGLPAFTISGMFKDDVRYVNFGASIEDKHDNANLDAFKRKMGAVPHSVYVFKTNYLRQPQKTLCSVYSFTRSLLR